MSFSCWRSRLTVCARACLVFSGALALGCASFPQPPYSQVVYDLDQRTQSLSQTPPSGVPLNRAASLPGRSQAEIRPQLEWMWHPSLRFRAWANYNGLIATRQSKFVTQLGPEFREGHLHVQHLDQDMDIAYTAAFHPGKRLPTVVATSGINGSLDGKITVDILRGLYQSGQFHVVHVESLTSISHQIRNRVLFAGGFPEGVLLYKTVAELRRQPEFAEQIDQVHLMGISYGGMLCGIAAHCETVYHAGVVDGAVLAISPPLDLKTLFQNLEVLRLVHRSVLQDYVVEGRDRYLKNLDLGLSEQELNELEFDSYVRKIGFPYAQRIYPALQRDLPDLPPLRDPEDLFALSSLRPLLAGLGVPFIILHAYDDPVVSPEDHFHRALAECSNPLVDGLLFHDGGHLGLDAVNGYPFCASVAQAYFGYWSANRP